MRAVYRNWKHFLALPNLVTGSLRSKIDCSLAFKQVVSTVALHGTKHDTTLHSSARKLRCSPYLFAWNDRPIWSFICVPQFSRPSKKLVAAGLLKCVNVWSHRTSLTLWCFALQSLRAKQLCLQREKHFASSLQEAYSSRQEGPTRFDSEGWLYLLNFTHLDCASVWNRISMRWKQNRTASLRSYDPKLLQLERHDLSKAQVYLREAFDHQASAKTNTWSWHVNGKELCSLWLPLYGDKNGTLNI